MQPYNQRIKNKNTRAKSVIRSNQKLSVINENEKKFKLNLSKNENISNIKSMARKKFNAHEGKDRNLIGKAFHYKDDKNRVTTFYQSPGLNPVYKGSISQNEFLLNRMCAQNRNQHDLLNKRTLLG